MKYIVKPEVVEAIQFDASKNPWPEYIQSVEDLRPTLSDSSSGIPDDAVGFMRSRLKLTFSDPDTSSFVNDGDWIVTFSGGSRCIYNPDNFNKLFTPVEE